MSLPHRNITTIDVNNDIPVATILNMLLLGIIFIIDNIIGSMLRINIIISYKAYAMYFFLLTNYVNWNCNTY